MERKQGAAVRPSRSMSQYARPRLVVSPRTYMDIVPSATNRPASAVVAEKKTHTPKPQQDATTFFDMKPLKAPSEVVQRTAPEVVPISEPAAVVPPVESTTEPAVEPVIEAQQPAVPELADIPPFAVEKIEPVMQKKTKPRAHKRRRSSELSLRKPVSHRVLQGMAALLLVAGIGVAIDGWLSSRTVQVQAKAQSSQAVGPTADEDQSDTLVEKLPAGTGSYRVAADLPRVLHIPSLAVVARVLHLGVEADNSLSTPKNIYDVGWYNASARPADTTGAIVIDGHVSGPTKQGVFYGLKKLKGGEEIVVERGDRKMTTFVVKQVETVDADKVDMAKLLESAEPGKLGLNLITCGGQFDYATNSYEARVVVYAVQK